MTREQQQNTLRLAEWIAKGGREKWLDEHGRNEISIPWFVLKRWAEQAGRIVYKQKDEKI